MSTDVPPQSLHLLLVEDDPTIAASVLTALHDAMASGSTAFSATHVEALAPALTALVSRRYDAVLLDLTLPGSSGPEVVRCVRETAPDVPIVVLAAGDDEALALDAVEGGAQDVVSKCRVDAPALTGALRYAFERGARERRLREREAELRHAQKMEAVGRLAGGVAHGFNNLLTVVQCNVESVLATLGHDHPCATEVREVEAAVRRAADLTQQLLAVGRRQMLRPRPLDVGALVAGSEGMLRRTLGERILLMTAVDPALWMVRADPAQLGQVLLDLARNARDAMPDGGILTVETANVALAGADARRLRLAPGQYVALTVRDSGAGMSADVRARIFEPFFTTKPRGDGAGLGLSTVLGIVEQSGGRVSCDSAPGRGSTFTVYLPRHGAAAPADETLAAMSEARDGALAGVAA
jgi:two-component system, cell cycle sensor histidine kinase and response regulator CckA